MRNGVSYTSPIPTLETMDGVLPVANGGTGAMSLSNITVGRATSDASGNNIVNTYVKKAGDTMTGDLYIQKDSSIANNYPAQLLFRVHQTDNDLVSNGAAIKVYDDHDTENYGYNMVIQSSGNMVIGGGEAPGALYGAALKNDTSENLHLIADNYIYLQSNANTIANRKGWVIDTNGALIPVAADKMTNAVSSIGSTTYRVNAINSTTVDNSGAATIGGVTTSNGLLIARNSNRYPHIKLVPNITTNASAYQPACLGLDTQSTTTYGTSSAGPRFFFQIYSSKTTPDTGWLGYYERYNFPQCAINKTGNNTYNIYTSKTLTFSYSNGTLTITNNT